MTFFPDKWILGRINSKDLILVRKSKRNLFLERISEYGKDNRELLTTEVLEEYDLALVSPDTIYVLYQNIEGYLILIVVDGNKKEEICLTSTGISEVFNLSLEAMDKSLHILYTIKGKDDKYLIYHHFYDGRVWKDFLVDEISVKKVINPIKALIRDGKLLLAYYNDGYSISIKSFDIEESKWTNPTKLIGGEAEKLFLDMLIANNCIHISFCEYVDGNLVVRYFRFEGQDENYNKSVEEYISNEGGPSHPTIIYFKDELWLVWLELDKVFSRCSKDNGQSWGPIYMWNETKNMDFIRYKFKTIKKEENIHLDYSFGSIYPEIRFLGFGPVNKAIEVPVKKKSVMKYYNP